MDRDDFGLPDAQIQVKNWKKSGLYRAYVEACGAGDGAYPIGVSRETVGNRREWVAAITLSLFLTMFCDHLKA